VLCEHESIPFIGESHAHHTIDRLIRAGRSVRNRRRIFSLAMVAERQPLERRPPGRGHLDSVRHRADLPAVALRPGLCRLWRLVHHPVDSVGVARRSRGAGSIRCHRGNGVPRGRDGDDVLAEIERRERGRG
jgi:hypothetical protein